MLVVCQYRHATNFVVWGVFVNTIQKSYSVFAKLIEEKGITVYRLFKITGVPQSSISEWKRGNSIPKIDKLIKIAEYFGVSVEYLISGEENEQKEKPSTVSSEGLSAKELEIIQLLRSFPDEERAKAFSVAHAVLDNLK